MIQPGTSWGLGQLLAKHCTPANLGLVSDDILTIMYVTWGAPRSLQSLPWGLCSVSERLALQFYDPNRCRSRPHYHSGRMRSTGQLFSFPANVIAYYAAGSSALFFEHKPFDHTKWQELRFLNIYKTRVYRASF